MWSSQVRLNTIVMFNLLLSFWILQCRNQRKSGRVWETNSWRFFGSLQSPPAVRRMEIGPVFVMRCPWGSLEILWTLKKSNNNYRFGLTIFYKHFLIFFRRTVSNVACPELFVEDIGISNLDGTEKVDETTTCSPYWRTRWRRGCTKHQQNPTSFKIQDVSVQSRGI